METALKLEVKVSEVGPKWLVQGQIELLDWPGTVLPTVSLGELLQCDVHAAHHNQYRKVTCSTFRTRKEPTRPTGKARKAYGTVRITTPFLQLPRRDRRPTAPEVANTHTPFLPRLGHSRWPETKSPRCTTLTSRRSSRTCSRKIEATTACLAGS